MSFFNKTHRLLDSNSSQKYMQMNRLQPALTRHEANMLIELHLCFQKPHDRVINLIVQTSPGSASIAFPKNLPRLLTVSWNCLTLLLLLTVCFSIFPCPSLFNHQGKPGTIGREEKQGVMDPLGNSPIPPEPSKEGVMLLAATPSEQLQGHNSPGCLSNCSTMGQGQHFWSFFKKANQVQKHWLGWNTAVHFPLLQPPFSTNSKIFRAALLLFSMTFFFKGSTGKQRLSVFTREYSTWHDATSRLYHFTFSMRTG